MPDMSHISIPAENPDEQLAHVSFIKKCILDKGRM